MFLKLVYELGIIINSYILNLFVCRFGGRSYFFSFLIYIYRVFRLELGVGDSIMNSIEVSFVFNVVCSFVGEIYVE